MIFKRLVTLSILFAVGFSVVHEYVYAAMDDSHCNVIEYVGEFDAPQTHAHGNSCAIHFEYHQSYLLSQKLVLEDIDYKIIPNKIDKETYNFKTHLEFYKPPIA